MKENKMRHITKESWFIKGIYESDGITPKQDRPTMPYSFFLGNEVTFQQLEVGAPMLFDRVWTSPVEEVAEQRSELVVVTANTIYVFSKVKPDVPRLVLKSDNPYETMNIHTPSGYKVIYAFPENGWDDTEKYNESIGLVVGETYTVEDTEVYSSYTTVYLKEFPDKSFNSVNFANAE